MPFRLTFSKITRNYRSYPPPQASMANLHNVLLNIKTLLNKTCCRIFLVVMKPLLRYLKSFSGTMKKFESVLFQLRGFHIAKKSFGVIGKQMGGSGLSDIL